MRKILLSILLLPIFAITFSGCLYNKTESTPTESESVVPTETDETSMEKPAADIQIDMQNFSFTPSQITAQAGETIVIELTSVEGFHDFVIDELEVRSETLSDGKTATVTIEIPEDASGQTYTFYCSIGNHREMGMEGTITVE